MLPSPAVLAEIGVVAAGYAVWLALFGIAWLATRPRRLEPAPPTQDFGGDEPPAVVSLLVSDWDVTEDAAESTLIDLAARQILEFRQPGNDPMQTTIHIRETGPAGLNPYERRIFDRVAGLAVGGVLPLPALTFRDRDAARAWTKRLGAEIVADARRRGLSQRRFPYAVRALLVVAGAIPVAAILTALFMHGTEDNPFSYIVPIVLFGWGPLVGLATRSLGERDTPAGRQAAQRWLGLKAYLRGDESFAEQPPAAVAVWDRYLSYGDAVGAARVCSAVIDLGMGNRKRVWSSFGGTWHRVRVRYPRFWRRYGAMPARLIVKSLVAFGVVYLLVRYADPIREVVPERFRDPADLALTAAAVALFGYGAYTLLATILDLLTPVTRTGEVLWVEVWRSRSGGEDRPPVPWLHYLAVDDGGDNRTVAWACPSGVAGRAHPGDIVTFTARRWTRRVTVLHVDEPSGTRTLTASHHDGSADTESLILDAMRDGTARPATRTVTARPALLLEPADVTRALGLPVVAKGLSATPIGPTIMESYHGHDGKRLVHTSVATGTMADLAIRLHRGSQPLPGIGDEAYLGDSYAVARRGSTMIMIQLHGVAAQLPPAGVRWLLEVAVSRMPA